MSELKIKSLELERAYKRPHGGVKKAYKLLYDWTTKGEVTFEEFQHLLLNDLAWLGEFGRLPDENGLPRG